MTDDDYRRPPVLGKVTPHRGYVPLHERRINEMAGGAIDELCRPRSASDLPVSAHIAISGAELPEWQITRIRNGARADR